MQDRYAGDIGDYVKFALLRTLSPGLSLGVAWYLYPNESHNDDGRHTGYLDQPHRWRRLDPELFDALSQKVRDRRSVQALEETAILSGAKFSGATLRTDELAPPDRSEARRQWFEQTLRDLQGCDLVFADPDNGLIDDEPHRRSCRRFGKQMPLSEALALADGRQAVVYHHNTRYPGGHDLEVRRWQQQLGPETIAVRANAYSCRTFFVINPSEAVRYRAEQFCERWSGHKVRFGPAI